MPLFLLFLSGFAALIFQTLWVKQLGLIVGVDVYAVTITISAFFAGLALGAAFFGTKADRSSKPLQLVAGLELSIACLSLTTTLLLARLPDLVWVRVLPDFSRLLILFALVGLPACFMGGTLPALLRSLQPDKTRVAKASGRLYAANTLGAIAGTLAVPLLLIPLLGVRGTGIVGAGLNIVVALLAYFSRRASASAPIDSVAPPKRHPDFTFALGLYAVAGGLALGYEVIWSQAILPFLSSRTSAFALMLATYLFGLMLGSFLYAGSADRVQRPWRIFGLLVGGAGASAFFIFAFLGPWLWSAQDFVGGVAFRISASNLMANNARFGFTAAVFLLLPTILLGAAFPAAARLVAEPGEVGRDVGLVTGLNLLGGIAGTLMTGYVLIPQFGLARSLSLLAVAAVVVGGIALWRDGSKRKLSLSFSVLLTLLIIVTSFLSPVDKLAQLLASKRKGEVVYYQESPAAAVAVLEQTTSSGNTFRRLYIQGVSNSGDSMTSIRYMRLQALLPLLIHNGEPRSALVIGMGTGITSGALLAYPGLEERVVAELHPDVVKATPLFAGNFDVASDRRMDIRLRDGRHELLINQQKYDLITLEPPPPSAAAVVNLYSQEFYELARDRLNSNGVVAQWWPLRTQNDEESRSLVASFVNVFPYVSLWTTEMHEALLVGSMEPLVLDVDQIRVRYEQPSVSKALAEVGVMSLTELLATYITGRDGLVEYVKGAEPVTDDRPRIEYAGWVRKGEFPRVLMEVRQLQKPPDLPKASPQLENQITLDRSKLWTLYQAGYYAYKGDEEGWRSALGEVQSEFSRNPYFNWFLGSN